MNSIEMCLRLGAALIVGGAIGIEREWRRRPAGLRTHLLVALASSTLMLISTQLISYQRYTQSLEFLRADITRIAAGAVMGIGFLGAGTIMRHDGRTLGLTTAASLWFVTALGLACGAGMFLLATSATLLALFVLIVVRFTEPKAPRRLRRFVRVLLSDEASTREDIIRQVRDVVASISRVDYDRNTRLHRTMLELHVQLDHEKTADTLLSQLSALPGVRRVTVRRHRNH